jgi:hypothetical protein
MAQALREPFTLVSRRLSSPPRQRRTRILPASPSKRQNTTGPPSGASKLVAALDALNLNPAVEGIEPNTDFDVHRPGHVTGSSNKDKEVGARGSRKLTPNQPNTAKDPTIKPYVNLLLFRVLSNVRIDSIHPFFRASTSMETDKAPPTTFRKNTISQANGSASSNLSIVFS